MFSSQHTVGIGESDGYDFTKSENAARWKGVFTPSLKKVLEQVHPRMTAQEEALIYVETLCLRILALLCAKPSPHSVQDIEEKVRKSFPAPIDFWALKEAKEISSKKKKPVFPIDRLQSLIQKDVLQYKIDSSMSAVLVAVLEYIAADILKLAGNYVRKIKQCEITQGDIEVAMNADDVLMDMFCQSDIKTNIVSSPMPTLPAQRTNSTYEEVVKELIHEEKQYQRDLHMIIRVFREELVKIFRDPKELETIFSNILDIYEVTVTLLGSLEDVIEMSQEQSAPFVGSCFEDLAEAEEFNVYTKYSQDITSQQSREALNALLAKPDAMSLMAAGHGFRDAVRYYLPKLLLVPIWHAFVYFDYIKLLMELSTSQEDIESFEQVQGLLFPLQSQLESIVAHFSNKGSYISLSSRSRRQLAIEKIRELQNTVEHWDKDVGQNCNEFIKEDTLSKLGSGKRVAERMVFLFDGLMVLCKANTKRPTPSTSATTYEYRLKEKFFMRRVEIIDRADTDELKNAFDIAPRLQPPVTLMAKNIHHKNDWMADLIMVNTKSMLDRILDSILLDIEKRHPLRMPSPEKYKFAIPDSPDNIVLEERESTGVPLIKGATLCKLIERLTYHIYADPMFVRTFLTTYRYFCTPQNLLTLLIERFNIPDPSEVYQDSQQSTCKDLLSCDTDKLHKNSQREDWKRYRKEYVQPVQFRVLNVLRHWVDHHFYDFEKDPSLLEKLMVFLDSVKGKSMRKWVDSVLKIVQRKNEQETCHKQITFAYGHSPPPIEHHLNVPDSEINLLTLHPLELARQMTLLEFELYKNVKPSELVGSPWTKKDKELKSPNLLKIMKHTTNITRWIEKSIVEADNFDERFAMVTRAIEVMMVMEELNNFNGILSISAAMGSASVFRLKFTFENLPARYLKFLEECRELNDGHLKKYHERLRSINPPCVPFFGRYLTNILHLEEGNPDFLPNTELINFTKRRKVSEIIGEIQQYQNQPYCLMVDPKIRNFLENLDPFKGMSDKDISNFLYHESLRIEPRGCKQPPKFPRKWVNITLKSPGIKPRRQNNNNNNNTSINSGTLVGSAGVSLSSLPFGGRSHVHAIGNENPGEHSPPGNSSLNQSNNPNAYTVFASINIPERNGTCGSVGNAWEMPASHGQIANAMVANTTPVHKADNPLEVNSELLQASVPLLPKKPAAMPAAVVPTWAGEENNKLTFIPTASEIVQTQHDRHDNTWHVPDEIFVQHQPHQHQKPHPSINTSVSNNNTVNSGEFSQLPSPLPKLIVSPRHEVHSIGSRSPVQGSINLFNKPNCNSGSHFSPTGILAGSNATYTFGANVNRGNNSSPQLPEVDISNATVPISPHVNVPTVSNVKFHVPPPPLPPRRKERTESCVDLAQKRQAPDAPTLPPRDGDQLSPPPVPPRLNHSIGTYPRSQTNEFTGSNSLQLPHTSSIMIRRNSAIEKRSANNSTLMSSCIVSAVSTVQLSSSASGTSASASASSSSSSPKVILSCNANTSAGTSNVSTDDLSPALSSSTTTSPMTPMTPISSPQIPIGYQSFDNRLKTAGAIDSETISGIPTTSVFTQSIHPTQHSPYSAHSQYQKAESQQQTQHYKQYSTTSGISVSMASRSSPKEFYTVTDSTPKLPPKPSLNANFYNNPDKVTMFLYPSTKQE